MTTDRQSRSDNSRAMLVRPTLRIRLHPILAALGLATPGDPLPALSGWRGSRRIRSV